MRHVTPCIWVWHAPKGELILKAGFTLKSDAAHSLNSDLKQSHRRTEPQWNALCSCPRRCVNWLHWELVSLLSCILDAGKPATNLYKCEPSLNLFFFFSLNHYTDLAQKSSGNCQGCFFVYNKQLISDSCWSGKITSGQHWQVVHCLRVGNLWLHEKKKVAIMIEYIHCHWQHKSCA